MFFCQQMASLAEVPSITTCVTSELDGEKETQGPCCAAPGPSLCPCTVTGLPAIFQKAFPAPPPQTNTSPLGSNGVLGLASLTNHLDLLSATLCLRCLSGQCQVVLISMLIAVWRLAYKARLAWNASKSRTRTADRHPSLLRQETLALFIQTPVGRLCCIISFTLEKPSCQAVVKM